MNCRDTKIHPTPPLPRKAHSPKTKFPRYMIIGLFDVELSDNIGRIGFEA